MTQEIKAAIDNFVELYKDELTSENIGDALHLNLSSQRIFAEDEDEFAEWENYAYSIS
jgi:hypothetical protein